CSSDLELMRADLAHGHQAEVVGDKGHQVLFLQDQRIAHEQIALLRLFNVRIERLQSAYVDHFQQLIEQHQQLALKFLATALVDEDTADLREHLDQHFLGVAHNQAADGGTEDDDDFRRLPEHAHVAIGHGVAAQHGANDDECTYYFLHDVTDFSGLRVR